MQTNQEIRSRSRRKRRKKALMTWLAVLAGIAVFAAGVYLAAPMLTGSQQQDDTAQTKQMTAAVIAGDISRMVYGSGSVQPMSQPGVYAKADGTVGETLVAMGDEVKAGDILMKLTNETLQSEAEQLQYDLIIAQQAVEDVETYSQMRYEQLYWDDGKPRMDVDTGEPLMAEYSNELSIRAPGAGRIVAVYIEPGDDALAVYREKGAVIVISTDGHSKVLLEDIEPGLLSLNDTLRVVGEGIDVTGRVENLARRGMEATIVIEGDEYGMDVPVSVYTQDGTPVAQGVLEVNKPLMVSAYGGIIRSVAAKVGQVVEDDDPLARFTSSSRPLYIDNASVLRDYAVAKASLDAVREKMDALTVVAPCDGKVVSVDVSVDAHVVSGDQLITLVEDAGMSIILTVDELDIPLVEKGQEVTMTVDALEGVTITGTVEKIAPLGNTQTSVTTYDVYIHADEVDARVLGGMNVSGEIKVDEARDALLIPTDAIQKGDTGYFVTLENGETRAIETGIMTVELTQVFSGLAQGETVIY